MHSGLFHPLGGCLVISVAIKRCTWSEDFFDMFCIKVIHLKINMHALYEKLKVVLHLVTFHGG